MRKLITSVVAASAVLGVAVQSASAAPMTPNGDVMCSEFAPPTVARDLIVASGTCFMNDTIVGRDVRVMPGAKLIDEGGQIGRNLLADQPAGIAILGDVSGNRGSVGHNVRVNGAQSNNVVCGTTVGNSAYLENSTGAGAGFTDWEVGDLSGFCGQFGGGAVSVTRNLVVRNNAGRVDVSDNNAENEGGIGYNLLVLHNALSVVESNTVMHNAFCNPVATTDGDGSPNQVTNKNHGCG